MHPSRLTNGFRQWGKLADRLLQHDQIQLTIADAVLRLDPAPADDRRIWRPITRYQILVILQPIGNSLLRDKPFNPSAQSQTPY